MRRLSLLLALLVASPAVAAPRKTRAARQQPITGLAAAKSDVRRTKADAAVAKARLAAVKARAAAERSQLKALQAAWMADCVYERTGPDGGIEPSEALQLCKAEVPTDLADLTGDPDLCHLAATPRH